MRPLRGLTWSGSAYLTVVIALGAALVPVSLVFYPIPDRGVLLSVAYLAVFTQLAAVMPIKWRRGKQTVDTMPLVAASLIAPGIGPVLISWLCRYDGRVPSARVPLARLLFNRARSAIEFGLPSMAFMFMPLPPALDVPVKTLCLVAGQLLIGYPLTGKTIAAYERESFWQVMAQNVGVSSIRSVLILGVGGGALYLVLQAPGGYVMGLGLMGLLFAVRSNMADAQRQEVERNQTLELLAQALDARDPMTELHSQRVSNLASKIALTMRMTSLEVERIRVAGLLHDIGKIGVPDSVLKKPGPLDHSEWLAMRRHADVGAEMIARHSALEPIAAWVRYHHERWNGSGYPTGIQKDDIPIGARILAVADSFDTITGPRVYRNSSLNPLEAVDDISVSAGILYDPMVVDALRQIHGLAPLPTRTVDQKNTNTQHVGSLDLLRTNGPLRALGSGMTISTLGDPLTAIAVTVSAFAITHNGLAVAAALGLRAAAMMAAGVLFGGAIDRWPRRSLIVAADLVQFATLLATPLLLLLAPWSLFCLVVVLGAASALSSAGRDAAVAHVVASSQLGPANSLIATGTTLGRTVGYPIAAAIIWLGASTTPLYLIDGLTFLVGAGLTVLAGSLGGGIESSRVSGAFRRSFGLPQVRSPLIVAGVGAFAIFMTAPAVIVLAYQISSAGARSYTILEVVLTVGMLAGALMFAWLEPSARTAVVLGLVLMGGLSIVTAASSILIMAATVLFIASVGNQLYFIGNRTLLQQLAPTESVGSVMATRGVLVQTLAILGTAAGGALSTAIGARLTYGIAGSTLLALAIAVAYSQMSSRTRRVQPGRDELESLPMPVQANIEVAESA